MKRCATDAQSALLDESFQWWTFVCTACGELTYVGQDLEAQTDVEFSEMCQYLYGENPVCTNCQRASRL